MHDPAGGPPTLGKTILGHKGGTRLRREGPDPRWVDAILDLPLTWPLARLALVSLFLVAALMEVLDFSSAVRAQEAVGLRPGAFWAVVVIAVQVTGSLIILSGRWIWLGSGMLGGFTAATTVVAHRFWELSGQARFEARNEFFEHFGLVAGFVLVALLAEDRKREQARKEVGRETP